MPTPTLSDEVTYVSGLNPDGTLALNSFAAWNPDTNPADYSGGYTNAIKWYGMPSAGTAGTPGGTVTYGFNPASNWTPTEENAFTAALDLWSAVANISFSLTIDYTDAGIQLIRGSDGGAVTSYGWNVPTGAGVTGGTQLLQFTQASISIDTSVAGFGPIDGTFSSGGGYPVMTMIHELGHAIGLGHGGPYNEDETDINPPKVQYSPYDSRLYSVMSYIDPGDKSAQDYGQYSVTGTNWGYDVTGTYIFPNSPTTWMPLDILAAQSIYGTPTSTPLSGGQTFGFNESGFSGTTGAAIAPFFDFTQNTSPIVTLWDDGTGNTLDLSGFTTNDTVNLNPGSYSSAGTDFSSNGHTINDMVNNIAIAYNTLIDTLFTGSGNDTITGNNDGDTFDAGMGTNTIIGGTGVDTLVMLGTRASYTITHNGNGSYTVSKSGESDTFTNIEKVAFSDQTVSLTATAPSDFNADSKSDILWLNSGSGSVQEWQMNGNTVSSSSTIASVVSGWSVAGTGDFNGDGRADILWLNASTGSVQEWQMNGSTISSSATIAAVGPGWLVAGTGDFNGDGEADILWMNSSTGLVQEWQMNGSAISSAATIATVTPGAGWSVAGTGDYNGDGKSDILWSNSVTGSVQEWQMNGNALSSATTITTVGPGWTIVGTGDFNGDGKADILWMNASTGVVQEWQMNGNTISSATTITTVTPGSGWSVAATGDYNGDGKSDILWTNSVTGAVQEWQMNGNTISSTSTIATVGAGWSVAGSRAIAKKNDFDGDGKTDLLWFNSGTGSVQEWQMSGNTISSSSTIATVTPGAGWAPVGTGDFSGDGKADILWWNLSTGSVQEWQMNGYTVSSGATIATVSPASGWLMAGTGDFNGDGKSDLLWLNSNTGVLQEWQVSGNTISSATTITTVASGWTVVGTGDFNGDGKADILWRNSNTGQVQEWQMNGNTISSATTIATVASGWSVAATGDFNGDGKSDILWMNSSTGQVQEWQMNGNAISSATTIATVASGWSVAASGDYNGDGKTDILWSNSSTGQVQEWQMNGAAVSSGATITTVAPSTGWAIVAGTGV